MAILISTFACAFIVTLLVVRWSRPQHRRRANDHDLSGPQKFHAVPVPRIGGLGIVCAMALGVGFVWWRDDPAGIEAAQLMLCAMPVFLAGLAEDLTKNVRPRRRLLFAALSAALAFWLVDAAITRTAIIGLDWLVSFSIGSALVTMFVVVGIANAVNIVDGFNGLASMCVVLMLVCIAYVAFVVGDQLIGWMALAGVGAVLGFFFWNFPAGLVFLGDGGAYFLGFLVSELAILLLYRNPGVSPMFPLLLCIYPVVETLFSIYRRMVLKGKPVGMPDGAHLHSLIYRRFLRWAAGDRTAKELTRRNSMTAVYLWMLCMLSVVPAVMWWDSTPILTFFIAAFALTYITLYWRIVRFKSPRWMFFRR
jgi:UDP-N-acetylmuramyl pentapeptide phosphotransferase/UDP-N-acetylglucosamine-1-phosphate transferase